MPKTSSSLNTRASRVKDPDSWQGKEAQPNSTPTEIQIDLKISVKSNNLDIPGFLQKKPDDTSAAVDQQKKRYSFFKRTFNRLHIWGILIGIAYEVQDILRKVLPK